MVRNRRADAEERVGEAAQAVVVEVLQALAPDLQDADRVLACVVLGRDAAGRGTELPSHDLRRLQALERVVQPAPPAPQAGEVVHGEHSQLTHLDGSAGQPRVGRHALRLAQHRHRDQWVVARGRRLVVLGHERQHVLFRYLLDLGVVRIRPQAVELHSSDH